MGEDGGLLLRSVCLRRGSGKGAIETGLVARGNSQRRCWGKLAAWSGHKIHNKGDAG